MVVLFGQEALVEGRRQNGLDDRVLISTKRAEELLPPVSFDSFSRRDEGRYSFIRVTNEGRNLSGRCR